MKEKRLFPDSHLFHRVPPQRQPSRVLWPTPSVWAARSSRPPRTRWPNWQS